MPTATDTFEFEFVVRLIDTASTPIDLFGEHKDTDEWLVEATATYRKLARVVHPDAAQGDPDEAARAFVKLGELWDRAQRKAGAISGFTITTKRNNFVVSGIFAKGDLANLYELEHESIPDKPHGLLKIPRSPKNSDLITAEAKALRELAKADPKWHPYFPALIENFRHRDPDTRQERRVNALSTAPGLVSLADVKAAYPDGIDPRDLAWMWRRVLAALGVVKEAGLVHGALVPEHILIQPEQHGVVLVDWCYSTTDGGKVKAIVPSRKDFYAPEVLAKEPATSGTDIYMASKVMLWMLGDRPFTQFAAFAKGSALQSQSLRPQDPWELQREFDELIDRLFGPRKFRVFLMPDTTERK